ncbi:MAG: LarC family nickel insertion protein [Acidobacteria bacterium]|nr:LarC family nickel insertion protein [Acidobacteriota bacterium]
MASHLWADPFSGLSGDIWIGGFLSLGVEAEELGALLRQLPFPDLELEAGLAMRCGIQGTRARILVAGMPDEGQAPHIIAPARRGLRRKPAHGRTWAEVDRLLSVLRPARLAELSRDIFRAMGSAEARVHGASLEGVHFHELGLPDSIADVVLAAGGWLALEEPEVHVGPVAVGRGRASMAHGSYPLPAPATAFLLEGFQWVPGVAPEGRELTTPTGAAIAATLATHRQAPPRFIPERIGFGAGGWDFQDSPNAARFLLGRIPQASLELLQFETNLDDATPQQVAHAQARALEAGALDLWVLPATFKKGRSGWVVGGLVSRAGAQALFSLIGAELPTLGIRSWPVHRVEAEREFLLVDVEGAPVPVKKGRWPHATHLQPEFEDARRAAEAQDKPLARVQDAARAKAAGMRRK